MKSILLIGIGQFGEILGDKLINMGNEVMVVDKDEDIINRIASKYTNAIIANCMNADTLKTLDIPSFDACVVTIADDFQSSLERFGREICRFQSQHGYSAQIPFQGRRGRSALPQQGRCRKTRGKTQFRKSLRLYRAGLRLFDIRNSNPRKMGGQNPARDKSARALRAEHSYH